MSKFEEFQKQKWQFISYDKQIMIITAAWKAAGSVMEGTKASISDFAEFADELIERYFLMEYSKPATKTVMSKTNNISKEPIIIEKVNPF